MAVSIYTRDMRQRDGLSVCAIAGGEESVPVPQSGYLIKKR